MHPVRDNKHAAMLAIIEPRQRHSAEGLDGVFNLLEVIDDVVRIINDDDVSATAGKAAMK